MTEKSPLKVVILNADYPHYEIEKDVLSPFSMNLCEIQVSTNADELMKAVQDADAVLVRQAVLNKKVIEAMRRCKIIVRYGVGVDNIDLIAAKRKRIYVANVPDYGSEEVADHALALMLSVARRTVTRDRDVKNGRWNIGAREPIHSFNGKTLGIIGYGQIGRIFHRKVSGLGFSKVLVYDPYLMDTNTNVIKVELETLCRQADFISIHSPLTGKNHRLMDGDMISLMKPTSILVNTSRGGLIDEEALVEALETDQIFGAGLDVFETEPPDYSSPLFHMRNVVVSDHTGWYSEESLQKLQKKAAQEIARVFSGKKPISWMNCWGDTDNANL
ncbi:C-terminal binding protein [Bacillus sp. 2205SS5-2]|uniref:C-terminal binding protein n=1 Tax=Bacillus sp. 2205SS5-2 TaxID=3109031 RepID=UPI00300738AD